MEIWVQWYTTETKEQSKQWTSSDFKEGEDCRIDWKGDGHCFLGFTKLLAEKRFESNEEFIVATPAYFAELKTYSSDRLKKLEHCWVHSI